MRSMLGKSANKVKPLFVVVVFCVALLAGTAKAAETVQLRWDFEEASGSATADSSGNNHATLYNNPTRVAGYLGSAISLNGVNQYVQSNTQIASLGISDNPYALSAWVKVPAGVQNGNIIHISSSTTGSGWCIPFLRLQSGVFQATGWDGLSVSAIGTTPVQADQWYQVLTTWDPSNGLRLFVNGVLEDSSPQATFDAYGSPVYVSVGLGNSFCSENQGFLRGAVDDVRIYDRVIEAEDINDITNPEPAAAPENPADEDNDTPPGTGAGIDSSDGQSVGESSSASELVAPDAGLKARADVSGVLILASAFVAAIVLAGRITMGQKK